MTAAYIRELSHARRDVNELLGLLAQSVKSDPPELTLPELMQAIGLATMAHAALIAAAKARHTDRAAAAPPAREQSTIFRDHRCYRCSDGEKPCVQGHPTGCSWPRRVGGVLMSKSQAQWSAEQCR